MKDLTKLAYAHMPSTLTTGLRTKEQSKMEKTVFVVVDIGGYNVPYHLQGLVLEHKLHPDKACAIADLFESTEDFLGALQAADTSRIDEAKARWTILDEENAARQ